MLKLMGNISFDLHYYNYEYRHTCVVKFNIYKQCEKKIIVSCPTCDAAFFPMRFFLKRYTVYQDK